MNAGRREDVSKKIRQGEWGSREVGQGDKGRGRQGARNFLLVSLSPCLLVSLPHSPLPIPFLRLYDLAYAALPNMSAFAVPNAFYIAQTLRASLERRLVHENLFDTGAQKSGHCRSRRRGEDLPGRRDAICDRRDLAPRSCGRRDGPD